jgi:predicted dehydrogenase
MVIDYSKFPLREKLRKVARYVRLFGPGRTFEKVRAHRHMRANGAALASRWTNSGAASREPGDVAIIGCGTFSYSNIAYFSAQSRPGFLRGCYDPVGDRSVSLCKRYAGAYAAADPRELLEDPAVRLVFIASNHASHAEYAIAALNAGKDVHIEKPHVVNQDQLDRLTLAMDASPDRKVYLGFNRPRSPHFLQIRKWLDAESGPLMINWFVAGHAIPDGHWYFAEPEGGRVLGNLCHWTDLSMELVGHDRAFPMRVQSGTLHKSKSDFVVSFDFADGSVAAITFSAKGETFEGVREYLNVHRGDSLIGMKDFHTSTLNRGPRIEEFRTTFRNHGHRATIRNSLNGGPAAPRDRVVDSARLFLAARRAVEHFEVVDLPDIRRYKGGK